MRSLLVFLTLTSGCCSGLSSRRTADCPSPTTQFGCTNGDCIPNHMVCDFHPDCADGSDEIHCDQMANNCMPPMWWTCEDGQCISSTFRCDEMLHCLDESDEKNCNGSHLELHVSCTKKQFKCDNMCIPTEWVCNGEVDCLDSTDEMHCTSLYNTTAPHCKGFTCTNGQCIYDHYVCDGKADCNDNSDEVNCTAKPVNSECDLNEGFFPCKDNQTCITAESLCNGFNDCNDGSDEGGTCRNALKNCAVANCSHGCVNTPSGPFCVCPNGYGRTSNISCEDLDECHLLHSHCSHHCHNVPGSFYCTCEEGYALQSDNRTCKVQGPDPVMMFTSKDHIMGYYLNSQHYFPIIQSSIRPIGVACDDTYIYYTLIEYGFEGISRAYRNGTGAKVIVKNGLKLPEDISVDWYTGNIYFTDSEMKHIGVCTNDGMHCTSVISKNIDKPRAIVLNPYRGEMYWTDWGVRPEIAKANMDGSNDISLVKDNIKWPNGLTADYPNERLYWVDGKHSTIESVRFDGSYRKQILRNINHPYWIAVFEDKMYWSDWGTNSIEMCDKFTGKDRKILLKVDQVNGLHIYHPTMAPKKNHSCMNHGCENICLLRGNNGYTCACPEGSILKSDKKSCLTFETEKYLLLATGDMLMSLHHKILGGHGFNFVRYPNFHIDALVHDSYKDQVIIYDDFSKKIYSIGSYLSEQRIITVLVDTEIGHIEGMDLDHISRNLYWCDSTRRSIEVLSLETRSRATLMNSPENGVYIDVAVVPDLGVMFLAIRKRNNDVIITKLSMDGKGTPIHVMDHGLMGPTVKLNYDSTTSQIFISNQGGHKIESVHLNGSRGHGFHKSKLKVGSLTSLGDEIFWVAKYSKTLRWIKKSDKKEIVNHHKLEIPFKVDQVHVTAVNWYPKTSNPPHQCTPPSSTCSHVCVLKSLEHHQMIEMGTKLRLSHHCLCPEGMVIDQDQKTCKVEVSCDIDHFRCKKSNVCIDRSRVCDTKPDCMFAEDEEGCADHKSECNEDQFQCRSGKCIERTNRCDKNKDCSDNSDEENCEHYDPNLHCIKTEFKCNSGICIDIALRCDGTKHCPDGDDENDCSERVCPEKHFHCRTGRCIPEAWECDSKVDCEDGSDEHNKCLYNKPCNPGMYKCRSGNCIDIRLYCDKVDDCNDGSDEYNCGTAEQENEEENECQDIEYACESNTSICLPFSARCNGKSECPNGEDELYCDDLKCTPSQWKCANSNDCIEKFWRCDFSRDCPDGSDEDEKMCDELHANITNLILSKSLESFGSGYIQCIDAYVCKSNDCVEYKNLCNGYPDCEDGSDENGKCDTACKNNPCSEKCIASPQGAICTCEGNRILGPDGFTCKPPPSDCLQMPPRCQHRCTDTDGSHICSCFEGYGLTMDRQSCKALGEPKSILYMNNGQIRKLYSRDNTVKVLHKDSTPPLTDMDVFVAKDSVFFTIESLGQIRHLNFTVQKETIVTGVGKPSLIAVDWVAENVYFVNNEERKNMMVCHMGKQKCAKLQDLDNNSTITAFVVDPINKLMFYASTSWTSTAYPKSVIYMANLDATHIVEMINNDLSQCSGLTVDYERRLLYFSNEQANKIESINYERSHRNVVFQNTSYVIKPRGLDLFEDDIYFLSAGTTKLIRCQLHDWRKCLPTNLRMPNVKAFKIDQQNKQKNAHNLCSMKNCTHICVQGEISGKCLCDDGREVNDNVGCGNIEKAPIFEGRQLTSENNYSNVSVTNNASGKALTAIIITVAIVVLVLGGIFLYRHQKKKLGKASKLDYSVRFQNPGFGGTFSNFSMGLGSITSRFPVLLKSNQNEFTNPIENKIVPGDWPPTALDPKLLQLKQKIPGCQLEVPNLLGDSDSDVESDRDYHDGDNKEKIKLLG